MFKALSGGPPRFTRIAIVADTEAPTPPCGACRQILWEFGGNLEILLANLDEGDGHAPAARICCRSRSTRGCCERRSRLARLKIISIFNLQFQILMLPTIAREADVVVMIDQRKLPAQEVYVRCRTAAEVARAIKTMVIRGAPAIGVAAAMGIALGMRSEQGHRHAEVRRRVLQDLRADGRHAADGRQPVLGDRADEAIVRRRAPKRASRSIRSRTGSTAKRRRIHDEDVASCRAMGAFGAEVVPADARILTHCNAGALATAGYGTALGVIRGAVEAGKRVAVFADETRPFLQGARLTAWELVRDGIETTVITDNMAGALMRQGQVELRRRRRRSHRGQRRHGEQDRHLHASPCSRASTACRSTWRRRSRRSISNTPDGAHIPIEERSAREVTHVGRLAARARGRAASGTRRSTSRRTSSSPASSPSAASSGRRTPSR